MEGVVFIVDAMFETMPVMDPAMGLEVEQLVAISQAAAMSRAAPAGLLRSGHCFRLCTRDAFDALPRQTVRHFSTTSLAAGTDECFQFLT